MPEEGAARPTNGPGRVRPVLIGLTKLAATVAVTFFIFRRLGVSLDDVRQLDLAGVQPTWSLVVAGSVILLGGHLWAGHLWATMATEFGAPRVGLGRAFGIFMAANVGRYLPGKFWQILGLTYLARGEGVPKGPAMSSALLGHLLALGAAAALSTPALFGVSGWDGVAVLALASAIYILGAAAACARSMRGSIEKLMSRWPQISAALAPVTAGFGVRWGLRFLGVWTVYALAFALFARGLDLRVELLLGMSSFAAAYFLGYVFLLAPAGIGIREGALSGFLAPVVGPTNALAVAVLARLWTSLGELIPAVLVAPSVVRRAGSEGLSESREPPA